ncbi:MAG: DNA gyrase subunit A [Candidatus Eisenbacteria bacterium]|nr:DNA gyrase subunit A [Candidatus Eisenbacteria bacterium]
MSTPFDHRQKIVPINIEDEMRSSYIDYSMSVIVSRALPDVRDGLKPSQRRILVAMHDLNLMPGRGYRKCAKIAGDTSGNYHPHGEQVVYPTLVRMAQDFNMRYPLVDGQGNFGCFTGETRIKLLDGTTKSFAELAALGPKATFHVYSVDASGRIVVGLGRNARVTRRGAPLVEVTLDSGERIRCTPDHRFLLRDRTYKEARALSPSDSLMPGYFDWAPVKPGLNGYLRVHQPKSDRWEFVHHLADEFNAARGLAKPTGRAFVRHHENFNRADNRPDNIRRMGFLEHLHLHAAQLKELWTDGAFRQAQRAGVLRYYREHPEARDARRLRFAKQNRDPRFRSENGIRLSRSLRMRLAADPQARGRISTRMRELWQDPDYRLRMSAALKGVEKTPLSPDQKRLVARIISEKSRAMWQDPAKRAEISKAIIRALESDAVRAKLRENAAANWRNAEYRSKFAPDHASRMAHALWSDPSTREVHRAKIARQWCDSEFRLAQREGVRASNLRRLAQDPSLMHRLAGQSAELLTRCWKRPEYRSQVMRSKIARYASGLLAQGVPLTPEAYEANRQQAWVPRLRTALNYFHDFDELVQTGRTYNHRVVSVRALAETAEVYDITVDEHHNFLLDAGIFVHNSIDGDAAAAMRYTEARLTAVAADLLRDIEKNTVDFKPNYDETREEPLVLPSVVPNLLLNGSSGIAVGMATEIPPHNLNEIADAVALIIDKPEATEDELFEIVKGPDFPTGGIIYGVQGIRDCYRTGRGLMQVRARVGSETDPKGRESLVVTQIPYQVNKTTLLEKIADLVKEGRVDGISDLRDESDRDGMRIVIELKKDAQSRVVLNNLFKHTQLQTTFGGNMLALVNSRPETLPLRRILDLYVEFRREVVVRRTQFDLDEAEKRAHILEGYKIALDNIDAIIALIKKSKDTETARVGLMSSFKLSEIQATAILEMRLQRLTGLERKKIEDEYAAVIKLIEELKSILASPAKVLHIIKTEILELRKRFGDERRTEIVAAETEIELLDLIPKEDMVVTVSHMGYTKRLPTTAYKSQRRGGKGLIGAGTKEEDWVEHLFIASTHNYILYLTDRGRCYWLKVHEIPQAGRAARGKPIVNLIEVSKDERVSAVVPVKEFDDQHFLVMATRGGVIKKTVLSAYGNPRRAGINAVDLDEGDVLIEATITDGTQDIILAKRQGKAIRFHEQEVRSMGRTAHGVKGVELEEGDSVVGMVAVKRDATLLTVTANGYGKRSEISEYRISHRGGLGIITIKTTERNGEVVGVKEVVDGDQLMLMSRNGQMIRTRVSDIGVMGRNTQGVRLMNLQSDDLLVDVARAVAEEEEGLADNGETNGAEAADTNGSDDGGDEK